MSYGLGILSPGMYSVYGLHVLASLIAFAGLFLLAVWAIKSLSHHQLKKWGITLLVVGVVVCGLLRLASPGNVMNWSMKHDRMGMSMKGMTMMLEKKTGDDFDKAFLEMMIPHHQGAIDMANEALTSAKHQEIKNMAKAIISAQQKEIDTMNSWYSSWGYDQ